MQLAAFGQEVELKKHGLSNIEGELSDLIQKNARLQNQIRVIMDDKEKDKAMFKEENEELSNIIRQDRKEMKVVKDKITELKNIQKGHDDLVNLLKSQKQDVANELDELQLKYNEMLEKEKEYKN